MTTSKRVAATKAARAEETPEEPIPLPEETPPPPDEDVPREDSPDGDPPVEPLERVDPNWYPDPENEVHTP